MLIKNPVIQNEGMGLRKAPVVAQSLLPCTLVDQLTRLRTEAELWGEGAGAELSGRTQRVRIKHQWPKKAGGGMWTELQPSLSCWQKHS